MWILCISPYESPTNEWECKLFKAEKEVEEYINAHDLTKEHYYLSVESLVKILQEGHNDEYHTTLLHYDVLRL